LITLSGYHAFVIDRVLSLVGRGKPRSEQISIADLMGLRLVSRDREEFVRGSQLRAADRMSAVRTTIALVSVVFADLLCLRHVAPLGLFVWTFFAVAARLPLMQLERRSQAAAYRGVTRGKILYHGALSGVLGIIWSVPMIFFTQHANPVEIVALWTLTSCLMTAVAIAFHSAPLASAAFVLPVGISSIAMMITRQSDPLLTAVVATYTLLLFVTSQRQAHQFGEQLSTTNELAEKAEVVSLLLKEHDVEGADWLWQTDADGRLKDVSPAFCRMLGLSSDLLNGAPLLSALAPPNTEAGRRDPSRLVLVDRLAAKVPFSDVVLPVQVAGDVRWWEVSASPRLDEEGTFLGFRGVGSDVTSRKESAERIAQLARHDILTNLPNRLSLTEELTAALDQMDRWKRPCAFLMIDLDRFKAVNDTLGHQIGDALLVLVADRLRAVCSLGETVGRLGGDEFAVVIHDVTDAAQVEQLALSIIDALCAPYLVENHVLHIGASIGSAISPQDGRSVSALVRSADLAMYRAKDGGGGRHVAFEPAMQADIEERRTMEAALREALAANELHLAYQPMVDVASGAITGFEALARWSHPVFGDVPPMRFIPIAEEARLIGSIGDWVLRNACVEAMRWPDPIKVAVNVSPEQLRDPAFLETVVSALAHSGLPASRLTLEVTETVFMRERTGAVQLLDKLVALGVGVALDDFGTGQISIGYFSRMHFGAIKIDRAFVAGAARRQRESMAIVRAAIAMAQSLGIDAIAEGVESMAELDRMRALGFDMVQGYHLGRPMPAKDAYKLVNRRSAAVA
jgi:diguanylate cyclase (GGDEF)-like protein/PAS domain S-box-containing protein